MYYSSLVVRCERWVFFNKGVSCFGRIGSPSLLNPRAEVCLVKSTVLVVLLLVLRGEKIDHARRSTLGVETGVGCEILIVTVWLHRLFVLVVLKLS